MFLARVSLCIALLALGTGASAEAASSDDAPNVHDLFEARCGSCHGHMGPLARDTLMIVDGQVRSRETGADVRPFLRRHYGHLAELEVTLIYDAMRAQIAAGGRFRERCRICHGRARELAKDRLIIVDGRLMGRYSGNDILAFLAHHGRPAPGDPALFHEVLSGLTDARLPVSEGQDHRE